MLLELHIGINVNSILLLAKAEVSLLLHLECLPNHCFELDILGAECDLLFDSLVVRVPEVSLLTLDSVVLGF